MIIAISEPERSREKVNIRLGRNNYIEGEKILDGSLDECINEANGRGYDYDRSFEGTPENKVGEDSVQYVCSEERVNKFLAVIQSVENQRNHRLVRLIRLSK